MEHLASKVLTQLVLPLGMGGLLILAGLLARALRAKRLAAGLSLAGLFWVWLWATPVFSDWVRGSLEGRYAPVDLAAIPNADAIVVLGGGVEGATPPRCSRIFMTQRTGSGTGLVFTTPARHRWW